jgi:hypothetical protein
MSLAHENIKVENSKYGFYWVHITFASLKVSHPKLETLCSPILGSECSTLELCPYNRNRRH